MIESLTPGCSVVHTQRKLSEARFVCVSKSGKRVLVTYNALAPWGVSIVKASFKPEHIRRA
ncbi:hypothetical protein D3C74_49430 [compost metagenome]